MLSVAGTRFRLTRRVSPCPTLISIRSFQFRKTEQAGNEAHLGRAEWINIGFAAATFIGGLFCAFYFFNGAELFRSVASWPRELLYARPPSFPSNSSGIFQGGVEEPAGPPVKMSTSDQNGNPFSRVPNLLFNDLNVSRQPDVGAAGLGLSRGAGLRELGGAGLGGGSITGNDNGGDGRR
jgi:hypothetical protein